MSKRVKRHFSAETKVSIIRKHLIEKVAISALCDEYSLSPNQIYDWTNKFFENGAEAFKKDRSKELKNAEIKIKEKDSIINRKDGIIAGITSEFVALKKSLGEL